MITVPPAQPVLPVGYYYADGDSITHNEVVELRTAAGHDRPDIRCGWKSILKHSMCVVAIRSYTGRLVALGRLAGDIEHATMCGLVVHPAHRNQGLGSAIIDERIRLAYELEVYFLNLHAASYNSNLGIYSRRGFTDVRNYFGGLPPLSD